MAKKRKTKRKAQRSRGGASYLCTSCEKPTHVVITRRDEDGSVRRVRECSSCKHKFQTAERVD